MSEPSKEIPVSGEREKRLEDALRDARQVIQSNFPHCSSTDNYCKVCIVLRNIELALQEVNRG